MFAELQDALGNYLLPFLIAVPLAIVVILISFRKGDDSLVERPPRVEPMAPPPAPAVPHTRSPAAVLVVDDSTVARTKLVKLFNEAGYLVASAKDGVEALEVLGRQKVDVLITDLEMPNKDGFELIADVKGSLATEDLPIIAITGHEELQTRVHEVQGLFGIFKKPWNDRELLKRVEALASLRKA
jgi:CheY-like chemotaxis protein